VGFIRVPILYKKNEAYTTALKNARTSHIWSVAGRLKPHQLIGKNLNRIRNDKGLTQEELAEKVGIDRRSLQRLEAGNWNMTVDYLERLRVGLGCTWQELFKGIIEID